MKHHDDHILTMLELEALCQLHKNSRLSVLEENELKYLLSQTSYHSPLIDDTRQSMLAEDLLMMSILRNNRRRKLNPKLKPLHRIIGAVASVIVVVVMLGVIGKMGHNGVGYGGEVTAYDVSASAAASDGYIVIAYDGGRQLDPTASARAVDDAQKRAEELMAMAAAKEKEDMLQQERIMKLTTGRNI